MAEQARNASQGPGDIGVFFCPHRPATRVLGIARNQIACKIAQPSNPGTAMTPDDLKALLSKAAELHAAQPRRGGANVSLDTIFLALAQGHSLAHAGDLIRYRLASEDGPPEWFVKTFARLRGTGETMTVGRFLLHAGRYNAPRSEALGVGRWLRKAGLVPRKSGGQVLFEL